MSSGLLSFLKKRGILAEPAIVKPA